MERQNAYRAFEAEVGKYIQFGWRNTHNFDGRIHNFDGEMHNNITKERQSGLLRKRSDRTLARIRQCAKKSKGRSGQSDLCNKRWQNDFACLDFNWEYDSWSGKDQAQ